MWINVRIIHKSKLIDVVTGTSIAKRVNNIIIGLLYQSIVYLNKLMEFFEN